MEEYQTFPLPNEHSLIIQSRNLRAKIRSMLPTSTCHKYKSRNKRLEEIVEKREERKEEDRQERRTGNHSTLGICGKIEGKGNCGCTKRMQGDFYMGEFSNQSVWDTFLVLEQSEIEKICDNKQYYLGLGHVESFNDFLKERERKKEKQRQKQRWMEAISNQARSSHNSIKTGNPNTFPNISNYRFNNTNNFPNIPNPKLQHQPFQTYPAHSPNSQKTLLNKSSSYCFSKNRSKASQKYQQILLTQQQLNTNKQTNSRLKSMKMKTYFEEQERRNKQNVEEKNKKREKVSERIKELKDEGCMDVEFKRINSELKKICGAKVKKRLLGQTREMRYETGK